MRRYIVFLICLTREVCLGGLLGAGTGHGSCAAFPFRSDFVDHIGGCPRWAECCTEYGYCHGKENWEEGYFRDCNGVSNGQPLPGSVIRIEAEQAASSQIEDSTGDSPYPVTAQVLGISEAIWQKEISRAVAFLSKSSSLSTLTTSSLSSTSSGTVQGIPERPRPSGVFPSGQTSGFSQSGQISGLSSTLGTSSTSGLSSTSGTSSTLGISSTSGTSSTSGISSSSGSFSQSLISQILLQLQPQIEKAVSVVISSQPTTFTSSLPTSGFSSTGLTLGFSTTGQNSGFSTTGQNSGFSTTGQTLGFSTTGQNSGVSSSTGQNSGFSTTGGQFPHFTSGISTASQPSSSTDLVALILAELRPLIASQVSQVITP